MVLIQRVSGGAYSADRFGVEKGRFSLYLLVWEITDSGTFFLKKYFLGVWMRPK
jgi:hypothetical protein